MMSSADLPACPACGSREVHAIRDEDRTLYACRQCGRDRTEAWAAIQPRPHPVKIIADRILPDLPDPRRLGIGATLEPATVGSSGRFRKGAYK